MRTRTFTPALEICKVLNLGFAVHFNQVTNEDKSVDIDVSVSKIINHSFARDGERIYEKMRIEAKRIYEYGVDDCFIVAITECTERLKLRLK